MVSDPAEAPGPRILDDASLARIAQWGFNGVNSNAVANMRDDLIASIRADRASLEAAKAENERLRELATGAELDDVAQRVRITALETALRECLAPLALWPSDKWDELGERISALLVPSGDHEETT